MRQTPFPSCQKLFRKARYQQPGDSSAIAFQTQCLSLWLLSFSFTVPSAGVFFSAATSFVLRGIYSPDDPPVDAAVECVCLAGLLRSR